MLKRLADMHEHIYDLMIAARHVDWTVRAEPPPVPTYFELINITGPEQEVLCVAAESF